MLTADRYSADELTQASLAKAFERWRRVTSADHPDAYVRRLMVNAFIDERRRRRDRPVEPTDPVFESLRVSDSAEAIVSRAHMWESLADLPRRQRAVLVLRYYEGYDDTAIAEVLSCAPSTVRSNASRGLASLRAAWTADGGWVDDQRQTPGTDTRRVR